MYTETAQFYDLIYDFKDYQAEVHKLLDVIHTYQRVEVKRLLDVACGTGQHLAFLKAHFIAEGLDLDQQLLAIARERNPDLTFHHNDMTDFDLGTTYDVITCLFSSIGYVKTVDALNRAIACMAHHLAPGGVLLVEPWFTPDSWYPGTVHARYIDEPDLKIARINTSMVKGKISYFDLHYLIGTPERTEHFVERHELGLFTVEEMYAAFEAVDLEVVYDVAGLTGRGLYIGH